MPIEQTVIYEAHVMGMTRFHPGVDPGALGTIRGLASDVVTRHLRDLGVTAVELMPIHQFVSEQFLLDQGLIDYWGYASIGFFAPHWVYSSAGALGAQVAEFKDMVAALHVAGLEVILDVVFNRRPTAVDGTRLPATAGRAFGHGLADETQPGSMTTSASRRSSCRADPP